MFIKIGNDRIPVINWENEEKRVTLWFANALTPEQLTGLNVPEIAVMAADESHALERFPGAASIDCVGYTYTIKPEAERALEAEKEILFITAAQVMTDEQAEEVGNIWPEWCPGKRFNASAVVKAGGVLYRCIQDHTAQADWHPAKTPALWRRLGATANEIPTWKMPEGAHDAPNKGDTVQHKGIVYRSLINANTTEPGSDPRYWELVEDD